MYKKSCFIEYLEIKCISRMIPSEIVMLKRIRKWVADKNRTRYLRLWFHESAITTEIGVEFLSPLPTEVRLIR